MRRGWSQEPIGLLKFEPDLGLIVRGNEDQTNTRGWEKSRVLRGVGERQEDTSGMVWHGMVWCGLVGSAVGDHPLALAPCASVRTFMRGPFVQGRQAHQ